MRQRDKQKFYESQYARGETAGPGWYQALKRFTKTREEVMIDYLLRRGERDETLLDLGCGEGFLLRELSPYYTKLIGTDIARNRIKLAKKKSKKYKNIEYKVLDLDKRLPFTANSAGVITCASVMEYVYDPYAFTKEVHRVLKKGGIFAVSVPNIAYLPDRMKLLLGTLPSWPDAPGWQGGRLHNFTFHSLERLLKESGFEIVGKQAEGFLQPLRNWWPSLLSGSCCVFARKK